MGADVSQVVCPHVVRLPGNYDQSHRDDYERALEGIFDNWNGGEITPPPTDPEPPEPDPESPTTPPPNQTNPPDPYNGTVDEFYSLDDFGLGLIQGFLNGLNGPTDMAYQASVLSLVDSVYGLTPAYLDWSNGLVINENEGLHGRSKWLISNGIVTAATAGLGSLLGAAGASAPVSGGKSFLVDPQVIPKLMDSRLGSLAGKITPQRLHELVNNNSARRFIDVRSGNINIVQEIEGKLVRLTVAGDKFKVISIGPIRERNIINLIRAGGFVPLP